MLDEVKKSGVPLAFNTKVVEITRYMGAAAWMLLRDSVCCTGDNMSLTEPLFPNYVNCDQFHAGPIRAATRANPPHMVNYGICVTPRGERYIDEGQTYVFVAQNTPKRIPENRAFIILDSRVRNEPIFDLRFKRYEKAKAPIYKADTIVELARQCGLPEAMLAKTVKEFNGAVHAGKGSKINKRRKCSTATARLSRVFMPRATPSACSSTTITSTVRSSPPPSSGAESPPEKPSSARRRPDVRH